MLQRRASTDGTIAYYASPLLEAAGVPHAFWNTGAQPARFIGTISPGGFENYLIELFELASKHPVPTSDLRPLIAQIGDKYDQVVVGPPPGAKSREEQQR